MSNIIKILITPLFLITASLQAEGAFDGFYAGVGGAAATGLVKYERNFSGANVDQQLSSTSSSHLYDIEPLGELFLGYGWQSGCGYFGIEVGGNFSDIKTKLDVNTASTDTPNDLLLSDSFSLHQPTAELTVDLRPGFVINDCLLLYLVGGVGFGKTKIRANSHLIPLIDADSSNTIDWGSEFNSYSTGRLGLGLEQKVTCSLSLRMQYLYSWCCEFSGDADHPLLGFPLESHKGSFSGRTERQTVSLALIYYFG